jgi:hypothetical protein
MVRILGDQSGRYCPSSLSAPEGLPWRPLLALRRLLLPSPLQTSLSWRNGSRSHPWKPDPQSLQPRCRRWLPPCPQVENSWSLLSALRSMSVQPVLLCDHSSPGSIALRGSVSLGARQPLAISRRPQSLVKGAGVGQTSACFDETTPYRIGTRYCTVARRYRRCLVNPAARLLKLPRRQRTMHRSISLTSFAMARSTKRILKKATTNMQESLFCYSELTMERIYVILAISPRLIGRI